MLQELLALMPNHADGPAIVIMIALAVVGLSLWLAGARLSRTVMTLVTVALGGTVGMFSPRWMGWDVNTMATALSGAMVLGAVGFMFPRFWVGIGLMMLLATWTAAGTWVASHGDTKLIWPADAETPRDYCGALWTGLPDGVKGPLPLAALLAAGVGLGAMILWPKVTTVLFYSATGMTALLATALWVLGSRMLPWPQFLPDRTVMQIVMLLGIVVLGAMVQWHWMPIKKKRPEPKGSESGGKVQASAR